MAASGKGLAMKYFIECLTIRRADCYSRASRREYWLFVLFLVLVWLIWGALIWALIYLLGLQDIRDVQRIFTEHRYPNADIAFTAVSLYVILMATAVPSLAVTVRRLHDTGRSGMWILLNWIPLAGTVGLLIACMLPGDKGTNRFGEDPRTRYSQGPLFKSDFACMKQCLAKYADFARKCNLQEYWSFVILDFCLLLLAGALGGLLDIYFRSGGAAFSNSLIFIVFVGTIVPLLSATAKRLRSAGFVRRWIWVGLVPFLMWLPFAGSYNLRAKLFGLVAIAGCSFLYVLLVTPDRDPQEGLI